MRKLLITLVLFLNCIPSGVFAENEIYLKGYGVAYPRLLFNGSTENFSGRLFTRINSGTSQDPAQELAMSVNFGASLNHMPDITEGAAFFLDNVIQSNLPALSGENVSMSLSGGLFRITNGTQQILNANLLSSVISGKITGPTVAAGSNEPLYPFDTNKFIYFTGTFDAANGTVANGLCNKGNITVRLHQFSHCTTPSKRCYISYGTEIKNLLYDNYEINKFIATIYDITIDKFDTNCGLPTTTPTATNTHTSTATYTPTSTYTPTVTNTATITPSYTPTNTKTYTPTNTRTSAPVYTPTHTATATRTLTPSNTATHTFTATTTATNTSTRTSYPTQTNTRVVTISPDFTATSTATATATSEINISMPKPVLPIAECIRELGNGQSVAVFGYNNLNNKVIRIPSGINNTNINFVSNPAGSDGDKPELFHPGLNSSAFEIAFSKKTPVKWLLEYESTGTNLAVADESIPACEADTLPICSAKASGGSYNSICQGSITVINLDGSLSHNPKGRPLNALWTTDCPGLIENPVSLLTSIRLQDPGAGISIRCSVSLAVSDSVSNKNCSTTLEVSPCDGLCELKDIKKSQIFIDSSALQIANLVKKLARKLIIKGRDKEKTRAEKISEQVSLIYADIWRSIWSVSSVTFIRQNTSLCEESSNSVVLNKIASNTDTLGKLAKSTARRLVKSGSKKSTVKKIVRKVEKLVQLSLEEIRLVPIKFSTCK